MGLLTPDPKDGAAYIAALEARVRRLEARGGRRVELADAYPSIGYATSAVAGTRTAVAAPSITLPFGGDWALEADVTINPATTQTLGVEVGFNGLPVTLANAGRVTMSSGMFMPVHVFGVAVSRVAGDVVTLLINSPGGGSLTGILYELSLRARPLSSG